MKSREIYILYHLWPHLCTSGDTGICTVIGGTAVSWITWPLFSCAIGRGVRGDCSAISWPVCLLNTSVEPVIWQNMVVLLCILCLLTLLGAECSVSKCLAMVLTFPCFFWALSTSSCNLPAWLELPSWLEYCRSWHVRHKSTAAFNLHSQSPLLQCLG
jgi:hypothetical protein